MSLERIFYTNHAGEERQIIILERLPDSQSYKAVLEGYGFVLVKQRSAIDINSILNEMEIVKSLSDIHSITLKKVLLRKKTKLPESLNVISEMISQSHNVPPGNIFAVYAFADGINLQNLIDINKASNTYLSASSTLQYTKELLQCLKDLKNANLAHRAVQPKNFILDKGVMKIINFSTACFEGVCGNLNVKDCSLNFLPPECFLYTITKGDDWIINADMINWQKADIFAVGMLLVFLITNGQGVYEHLFNNQYEAKRFFQTELVKSVEKAFSDVLTSFESDVVRKFTPLILGMIHPNPDERWNIEMCMEWLSAAELEIRKRKSAEEGLFSKIARTTKSALLNALDF